MSQVVSFALVSNKRISTAVYNVQVADMERHALEMCTICILLNLSLAFSLKFIYTQGEVTSHTPWSRYDCHFVSITRFNALR